MGVTHYLWSPSTTWLPLTETLVPDSLLCFLFFLLTLMQSPDMPITKITLEIDSSARVQRKGEPHRSGQSRAEVGSVGSKMQSGSHFYQKCTCGQLRCKRGGSSITAEPVLLHDLGSFCWYLCPLSDTLGFYIASLVNSYSM